MLYMLYTFVNLMTIIFVCFCFCYLNLNENHLSLVFRQFNTTQASEMVIREFQFRKTKKKKCYWSWLLSNQTIPFHFYDMIKCSGPIQIDRVFGKFMTFPIIINCYHWYGRRRRLNSNSVFVLNLGCTRKTSQYMRLGWLLVKETSVIIRLRKTDCDQLLHIIRS